MTDQPDEPTPAPADETMTLTKPNDTDWLLEIFADSAHSSDDFRLGVTFVVQGLIVSGVLVSRDRWLTEINDKYPGNESVTGPIKRFFDEDNERFPEPSGYAFVHLVECRYFPGLGSLPTGEPAVWRGRISEVSGWSWGQLRPGDEPE